MTLPHRSLTLTLFYTIWIIYPDPPNTHTRSRTNIYTQTHTPTHTPKYKQTYTHTYIQTRTPLHPGSAHLYSYTIVPQQNKLPPPKCFSISLNREVNSSKVVPLQSFADLSYNSVCSKLAPVYNLFLHKIKTTEEIWDLSVDQKNYRSKRRRLLYFRWILDSLTLPTQSISSGLSLIHDVRFLY